MLGAGVPWQSVLQGPMVTTQFYPSLSSETQAKQPLKKYVVVPVCLQGMGQCREDIEMSPAQFLTVSCLHVLEGHRQTDLEERMARMPKCQTQNTVQAQDREMNC